MKSQALLKRIESVSDFVKKAKDNNRNDKGKSSRFAPYSKKKNENSSSENADASSDAQAAVINPNASNIFFSFTDGFSAES